MPNELKGIYVITADQLKILQVLVWGARFTQEAEPTKFAELIEIIKNQELVLDVRSSTTEIYDARRP